MRGEALKLPHPERDCGVFWNVVEASFQQAEELGAFRCGGWFGVVEPGFAVGRDRSRRVEQIGVRTAPARKVGSIAMDGLRFAER